jgi:hypothetical protein
MEMFRSNTPERQAAVQALAIVGFIALVVGGMWLAVYSARYVPGAMNRLGAAAVYLGSVFNRGDGPDLTVVPTGTSTISFGNGTSTTPTTTPPVTLPRVPRPQSSGTVQPSLFGQSDLLVTISSVTGDEMRFNIRNIGTNVTGPWRFNTTLPVNRSARESGGIACDTIGDILSCTSDMQPSLRPGDNIDYTLEFDRRGSNRTITVTADFNNQILESNENNNSITATVN